MYIEFISFAKIILSALNNREFAIIIWLAIACLSVLISSIGNKEIRNAISSLFTAFFKIKLLFPFFLMLLWVGLIIFIARKCSFWDISASKDTIIWIFGTVIVNYFNVAKFQKDTTTFRKIIFDNFKLTALIEFIVNLYAFSLVIELIIQPVLVVVVVLKTISESKPEFKKLVNPLKSILGLYGIIIILFTFREIWINDSTFFSFQNLRDFLLPPLFTLAILPFYYFLALFTLYEELFIRIEIMNNEKKLIKIEKWMIFCRIKFNLRKLIVFSKKNNLLHVTCIEDISTLIN